MWAGEGWVCLGNNIFSGTIHPKETTSYVFISRGCWMVGNEGL